jgi:SAM-dependent methyltransferase
MVDAHPPEQGDLWTDPGLFDIYDEHRGLFRETQAKIIDKVLQQYEILSGPIAEIGSGAGHLYSLLPDQVKTNVVGIEGTPSFADIQKQKFPESQVVVGNAYTLPLADSSVRTVLSYSVYDTFQNLNRAILETKRVLQLGGKFIHFLDLEPNYGMIVKDIPVDQIPFPRHENGSMIGIVLVPRSDYETKIRPKLDPRKILMFDLYAKDPVNILGILEVRHAWEILADLALTVAQAQGITKVEMPIIKEMFKKKLEEELQKNGFKIIADTDMTETMELTPNLSHKKLQRFNNFEGDVGRFWWTYNPAITPGKVREKSTLQVVVAQKQ